MVGNRDWGIGNREIGREVLRFLIPDSHSTVLTTDSPFPIPVSRVNRVGLLCCQSWQGRDRGGKRGGVCNPENDDGFAIPPSDTGL